MVLVTLGALGLAAGGAAYVKTSPKAAETLEIALGWKRPQRRTCSEDGAVPFVDQDAPLVRCFGRERCGEQRLFALFTDQVLLNSTPGEPQETFNVTGAEVTQQGAVVILQWSDSAVTLWFENVDEAEFWGEALGFAAGVSSELAFEGSHEKVQELEDRVATALRAAYERSARIKELEDTIEAGKERELRIHQLEEVLHDTLEEAEARAEKIEMLEWKLESRGSDPAATALLQDAMDFADELLEQHSDLWTEDDSAAQLREAVQAVQQSKPDIDSDVAELIRQLVTALRWPVVLRERLADAEATMKEQEEIQEEALREIIDLQKQCDTLTAESEEQKTALAAAKEQKSLTDAAHEEEMQKLKEREEAAERKRLEAEEKAKELRELLDYADQAAEEAVQRKRAELEKAHAEEIQKLRHLTDVADTQQKEAHAKAVELHEQLAAAEAAIDARAAEETEKLSAKHQEEITSLKRQIVRAEEQRDHAKGQANSLNKQLEDSQTAKSEELDHLKEALDEARKLQSADRELLEERQKQDAHYVAELEELKRNREASDRNRAEAEGHLSELREMLASAQKRSDDAVESSKSIESKHAQAVVELRGMQSRCESAEIQEELAEAKAQRLKEKLMTEMQAAQAADEGSKMQKLEKARDRELEDVRQLQREAESNRKAADARAEELRKRLEEAERRAHEAAQQQKASLDAAREEEVNNLRKQMQTAEEKVDKMESQASQFREKLAAAEVSLSEEAQRRRDLLESERLRSLGEGGADAAHWKIAADQAHEQFSSEREFKSEFGGKDKELEQRLENAERALKSLEASDEPQSQRSRGGKKGRRG
ncbi:unnamed protein product [Durusdinium trenchii]|uniref:Laminin-like protein epi-1 n=2 Tax=Durusdinium trenchii TaxID=1381693 RepID=A0ABP0PMF3_9DINO